MFTEEFKTRVKNALSSPITDLIANKGQFYNVIYHAATPRPGHIFGKKDAFNVIGEIAGISPNNETGKELCNQLIGDMKRLSQRTV